MLSHHGGESEGRGGSSPLPNVVVEDRVAQIDFANPLAHPSRFKGESIHEFSIDGHLFAVFATDEASPVGGAFGLIVASFSAGDRQLQLVSCSAPAVTSMDAITVENPLLQESGSAGLLTARELQIVQLVASGHSNKLIAKRLQISEWTVSSHLKRIFLKLGVDTRAQMVHVCMLKHRGHPNSADRF